MSIKGAMFPDKNGLMFGIKTAVMYKGSRYTVVSHTSHRILLRNDTEVHMTTPNMVEVAHV